MVTSDVHIGVDIVEVERIGEVVRSRSILERTFTPGEVAYCNKKIRPLIHFAGRFAGKEALIKAFSNHGVTLHMSEIEIINDEKGIPTASILRELDNTYVVEVSISHTERHAVGMALVKAERT